MDERDAEGCERKKMVTPAAKRTAVAHLCDEHRVSQRRAGNVLQVDRSTVRYQSVRVDDVELRDAIKRVSRERRRFGYRRIHVMVEREGHIVNHKKLRRIYTEEKLQVRRRGGRKRALGTRTPMVLPDGPNQRWSLDFVSDAFTDGRRFRILTVVDDFTRENLALVADTSLSGLRVTRELDKVIADRGQPGTIVSEFVRIRQ
jgi:putative transposase